MVKSSKSIVLGGGCFWCLEASFQLIIGVVKVEPGYSGGRQEEANYDAVCAGLTNHAEVVKVTFDTTKINLGEVLDIFWAIHDPTSPDRQGNDIGRQYRSVIFYSEDEQLVTIQDSIKKTQALWKDVIVTQVEKLEEFYPAEEYHHDYFKNNPEKSYCQVIINPKLSKLRADFAHRIKG